MNSYERVMARLKGEKVDKIPNLNIIMAFAAKFINEPYSKYATDYKTLVKGNIECSDRFGIDAVSAISDPCRELAGYGAKVEIPYDDIPFNKDIYLKDLEIDKLKSVNPYDCERMLDRIKAIEEYKKQVKGKKAIIGWVEGCFAEAADLMGVNDLMMNVMVETEYVKDVMERIYETQFAFAKAQIDAGCDIVGVGDAVASLIGEKLYTEFAYPYEKRLIEDIHKIGGMVKLHICGNIEPLLSQIATLGADIVDVDFVVNFEKAVKTMAGTRTSVCGNIEPVGVFLQGNVEKVERFTRNCVEIADNKTIIAGGCEIPMNTPYENMDAMNKLLYIK